jgi:sugar/nucleoside kinase (ribokinase family)
MPKASFLRTLIIGNLAKDFIIDLSGKAHNNIPGGALLYTAAGARSWNDEIGLISRVNETIPHSWISDIEARGFETRGIENISHPYDSRRFFGWRDTEHFDRENPVANYAKFGLTFPRDLLGYHAEETDTDEMIWGNISTAIKKNLPREFLDVTAAHICPMDLSTQIKFTNFLESGSKNTLTISPSDQYMSPGYLDKLPVILSNASAFLPTETQLQSLCHLRTKDIWEMAELISDMGCPMVVILRKEKGYWLYDSNTKKRITLPAYPNRWVDPTGAEDVFAGAFLGEYKNSYDPVKALLCGCVSSSLAVEGTGPFYCLDALPGLMTARLEMMKSLTVSI